MKRRKYRSFRTIIQIGDEEIEKCYYCGSEGKAKEHAQREFGPMAKVLYTEEIIV